MSRGRPADLRTLASAIAQAWSRETASTYTEADPARGQCSVTALAVHQLLGGEILKTPTPDGMHFYNGLDGRRVDLTAAQFRTPPSYADLPSGPEEAMTDTSPAQLAALIQRIERSDASDQCVDRGDDTVAFARERSDGRT